MIPESVHLAAPFWLWGLLLPLLLLIWPGLNRAARPSERIKRYADPELLPHLLVGDQRRHGRRRHLIAWVVAWSLGIVALAGPRWDYREVTVYQPGANLAILLDLSASMNATDLRPSRLARARQEIQDLLDEDPQLRIGLVAFASTPYVVAPITEDLSTLRHLLPSISTELTNWKGSRLSAALERSRSLLMSQSPESSKAMLLVSDGDFDEPGLLEQARALREQQITLHVLAVGSEEGGLVPKGDGGSVLDRSGRPVRSRLDRAGLSALAEAGGGLYREASYLEEDTRELIAAVLEEAEVGRVEGGSQRVWNERFYLLTGLMLLLMLPWFRYGRPPPR